MENMENRIFDMLRDPEIVNTIRATISDCLDGMIPEIMKKTGLTEVEVLDRLRRLPAGA